MQEHVLTLLLQDSLLAILRIVQGLQSVRDRAMAMKAMKARMLALLKSQGRLDRVLSRQVCAGGCSGCAQTVGSGLP